MAIPKVPIEHINLLLLLSRSIDKEAFEEMKLVARADDFGGFYDAELEKIMNVREMLRELEAKRVIGVGEYRNLKEIMRSIGNESVIEDIDGTEDLLNKKGYRIASKVSNAELTPHRVSEPHQSQASCSGETAEGPLQAANKVEKMLRNRYKTTGSFVQIIPWVGDDMKPISDIYTKLMLLNTDHQGKQMKSYEDIFFEKTKEGLSIQRTILEGKAGVGKSTLFDKMAYDWACGKKLQEYKLVFLLKMFSLEESVEFVDAIFYQLVDEDVAVSKADLRSYIITNPAKVLILFDGFDEFKTTNVSETLQSSGDVSRILNRKIFRDGRVVVTTRPSHFDKLVSKSLIERPFTCVRVLGFNETDIEQYIHRFFSNEHDKAEGLIQKIKSSKVLFDLAKSPMLLLLMCILWREQSTIPDTIYRLYKDALRYIFRRKKLPSDETTQVVITIGKNALDDLLSPHQLLSFEKGDFEDQALGSALKAGVLTSQRVIKGLDTRHIVSFIHRTFQEYCAAIFFQSLLRTDEEQFNRNLDRVENIMKDNSQGLSVYLLRFCCGDNQSCTNKVLSLMQKCFGQRAMISKELSVMCYLEGQFEDLPSVDLVTETMNIQGFSNDGLHAFFYYLKHVTADDKKNREEKKLGKVTCLTITEGNLESFGEVLGEAMSGMINLSTFKLLSCFVTPASMEYIVSSLLSTPMLTKIIIRLTDHNKGIWGCVPSWGQNPLSLKLLRGCEIIGCHCPIQHRDIKYIAVSLGLMKNLVYCQISQDNHPAYFLFQVNNNMEFFDQRKETYLHLSACSVTSSELSDILSGIKTREDSFSIYLACNPLLGGLANVWAQHLKYLKHLRQLYLVDCALQSKDIEPLAGSLSDTSTLATLGLSDNPSLGGNAVSWASHLGKLNQVKEMYFCNCSLRGVDIEPIAKSVGNIYTLDLSENLALMYSVESWTPSLRHFKNVRFIFLSDCDFTSEEKTLIMKVQQQMSNTVDFFISKIKFDRSLHNQQWASLYM